MGTGWPHASQVACGLRAKAFPSPRDQRIGRSEDASQVHDGSQRYPGHRPAAHRSALTTVRRGAGTKLVDGLLVTGDGLLVLIDGRLEPCDLAGLLVDQEM